MAVSALVQYGVAALAPFLVADMGLSRAAVGGLVTAAFAVAAGGSVVAGHLVDLLGARIGLVLLCLAVATGLLGAAAAGTYVVLAVAVAVAGLGQALANPATNVLVAGATPSDRRGAAIGVKQAGVQVAAFGTGLVLPVVAAAGGWRAALGWTATLPAVLLVVVWRLVPARGPGRGAGRRRWSAPSRWLRWLVAYSLLLGAGLSAVTTYLSLYAVQRLGLAEWTGGMVLAALGVTGLVSRVLWGRWADRLADLTVALAWLPAAAVGAASLLWASGPVWSGLVWLGAVGVGGSATAANAISMLAVVRRGGPTGHASGLVSVGFFGGFVVGPALFGVVADRSGYGWAWLVVAVCFAGAALTSLRIRAVNRQPATVAAGT
ncbi:hypothetical protein Prum_003020 [Phytohabitans rumicis]|uniref:Major facilitator superfamily (MFS) profile domain-containing protein n=2 Tax=Phytohabitans rumicis TaxID=1076125 RepID=A0A6V8KTA6_9ACTN|nr:hypothetical protein Prum_003020 [Phytohabitans rumicis]